MENLKDSILKILESIVEKTGQLESHNGQIPQIEIDIILSETQQLYEKYKLLAKVNNQTIEETIENKKIDAIIDRSELALNKIESFAEENIHAPEERPESIKEETVIEEQILHNEKQDEKPKFYEEEKKEVKETLGDKLQDNQKSLNDKIGGGQKDNTLGTKLQKNPISDLKVAIGVNEKFLFTKELFNDNSEDYQRVIAKLNQMESLQAAMEILNSLKLRYQWNDHPETYEILLDLVNRRYMA